MKGEQEQPDHHVDNLDPSFGGIDSVENPPSISRENNNDAESVESEESEEILELYPEDHIRRVEETRNLQDRQWSIRSIEWAKPEDFTHDQVFVRPKSQRGFHESDNKDDRYKDSNIARVASSEADENQKRSEKLRQKSIKALSDNPNNESTRALQGGEDLKGEQNAIVASMEKHRLKNPNSNSNTEPPNTRDELIIDAMKEIETAQRGNGPLRGIRKLFSRKKEKNTPKTTEGSAATNQNPSGTGAVNENLGETDDVIVNDYGILPFDNPILEEDQSPELSKRQIRQLRKVTAKALSQNTTATAQDIVSAGAQNPTGEPITPVPVGKSGGKPKRVKGSGLPSIREDYPVNPELNPHYKEDRPAAPKKQQEIPYSKMGEVPGPKAMSPDFRNSASKKKGKKGRQPKPTGGRKGRSMG